MTGVELGARCIRGPDWSWGEQDGGVGHVGTVVLLGHSSQPGCLPGTVMVVWDNGVRQNYRAGYANAYDLRLLDNSPSGVYHNAIKCDGCGKVGIFGIRWSCKECANVNLCSRCYCIKLHDVNHEFLRYVRPDQPPIRVGCRMASQQTEIIGAFRGAIVVRGHDWEWGDQDGGPGSQGRVKEITNWNDQTGNSVACVVWSGSKENLYRLGHKSKVDIRCIQPSSGGKIYPAHLPLLGKPLDAAKVLLIGQTVEVSVELDSLKQLQIGHGEFRMEMANLVGRRGKVHRITEKGDVRVQFANPSTKENRWTINPMALTVIHGYNVGDRVTITSDRSLVEKYHQNFAALEGFIGCSGTVSHVHSEASLVVDFGAGRLGAVHSRIILPPQQQNENANINIKFICCACAGDIEEVNRILMGAGAPTTSSVSQLAGTPDNEAILTGLHKAAGKGFLNIVVSIIKFRPVLINQKFQDKTPLMITAYEGDVNMMNWLLLNGGDGAISDSAGDLPIHYAAIGSKPMSVLSLVDKGSPVNSQNKEKRAPLHLSVINQHTETVKSLLKVGASVNVQDKNSETPLHIAINSGSDEIASLLIPLADLLICEQNGLNALHLAVRQGKGELVERIIQEDRLIVNIVTRDGISPLHMAAQVSMQIVRSLVSTPQCDVNIQDAKGRSVLHYAARTSHLSLISLLLQHRVNVNLRDCGGNTAAHLALIAPPSTSRESPYTNELDDIFNESQIGRLAHFNISPGQILQVAVVVELLKHGEHDIVNQDGETVLDLIENTEVRKLVEECILVRPVPSNTVAEHDYAEIVDELGVVSSETECRVCSEPSQLVIFQPCLHKIVCQDCSLRIKKCLSCQTPLIKEEGSWLSLRQKVCDLEEQLLCGICMERNRNVVFLCGHGACTPCTQGLVNCHMCRTKIEKKIPLY